MLRVAVVGMWAALLGGCVAFSSSPYRAAPANYELLQNKSYKKLALGEFSLASEALNTLRVRDGLVQSPIEASYAAYLKAALDEELYKAGVLRADATRR